MKTVTNNNLRTRKTLNQDNEFTSLRVKAFILKNIDLDGYDLENTPHNLFNTFVSEYGYMIPRVGKVNAFKEWLQGVPSAINLPIYYYDVNNVLEDEFNALIYNQKVTVEPHKETVFSYIQNDDDTRQYERFLNLITVNLFNMVGMNY